MGKRIRKPINETAAVKARTEFYKKYPQFVVAGIMQPVAPNIPNYKTYREKWIELYERFGGGIDKGTTFQAKSSDDLFEPVAYDNPIQAIYILDGGKQTYLAANGVQHVNLPAEQKWVDGVNIMNIDRLSRKIRVKVEFGKARKEWFAIRMLSHQGNANYTANEQLARPSFSYARANAPVPAGLFTMEHGNVYRGRTNSNGVAIIDNFFEVTPAVGDRYKFQAWDYNDNQVLSVEIVTQRTIFYMTMATNNAPHAVATAAFRAAIEPAYSAEHTQMIYRGHETLVGVSYADPIAPLSTLNAVNQISNNPSNLNGRSYSSFLPFLLRFVFTDQIATSCVRPTLSIGVKPIAPGAAAVRIPIKFANAPATDPGADMRKALWIGFGTAELDGARETVPGNNWFVGAEVRLASGAIIQIPVANCTPIETDPANRPGLYNEVEVRVDNLTPVATTGDIKLTVIAVNQMVLGMAKRPESPGTMIMASRHLYRVKTANEQISASIHEMGHALGMVANFNQVQVETPLNHYELNGDHCHLGLAPQVNVADYHSDPNAAINAQCVMFGFVTNPPRFAFCPGCQPALKKLDIGAGFS